jgi:hypothetical protein
VWIDPRNGPPYLLVFLECLFLGNRIPYSLICPNQLRSNGVKVHDVPRQFDHDSPHAIVADGTVIPLELEGSISYFETRLPRSNEIDELPRLTLTAPGDWFDTSANFPAYEPPHNPYNVSALTYHTNHRSIDELDDDDYRHTG